MFAQHTAHAVYRNFESFRRVDHMSCRFMKPWEDGLMLCSTQSVLETIANRLVLLNWAAGQIYQLSYSDDISKRGNGFIQEVDDLIDNYWMY